MSKKLTQKIIAAHFNVSVATVSMALKNSKEIGKDLREKIQEYAKIHHYKPNIHAVNLKGKPTKTIGVILPNILNPFFAKVLSGIDKIAYQNGVKIITSFSNDILEKEMNMVEMFMQENVAGIMISLAEETQKKRSYDHFNQIQLADIPLVMLDRVSDLIDCDKVVVDDKKAAYQATEYLLKSGCSNIALVSNINNTSVGRLRLEGYKNVLTDNNLPIQKSMIIPIGKNDDLETMLKITLGSRRVDGILCLEETTAVTTLEVVKKMGYSVPYDISIIGFTNGELMQHISPPLTTVSQHGKFIGETATTLLLNRIDKMNHGTLSPSEKKVVKTSILKRKSTL